MRRSRVTRPVGITLTIAMVAAGVVDYARFHHEPQSERAAIKFVTYTGLTPPDLNGLDEFSQAIMLAPWAGVALVCGAVCLLRHSRGSR